MLLAVPFIHCNNITTLLSLYYFFYFLFKYLRNSFLQSLIVGLCDTQIGGFSPKKLTKKYKIKSVIKSADFLVCKCRPIFFGLGESFGGTKEGRSSLDLPSLVGHKLKVICKQFECISIVICVLKTFMTIL